MERITDLRTLQDRLAQEALALVYVSGAGCSVCAADRPKAEKLARDFGLTALEVAADQAPACAAQLTVFSVPAVLIFVRGREVWRGVSIIDFGQARRLLARLTEQ